jgi:hypothetical protein
MSRSEALGGCYCGAVRYAIVGPPEQALVCHCSDCRRSAGAQSVAWLVIQTGQFEIRRGAPKTFESSPGVTRTFCGRCGTTLTWVGAEHPGRIDVTIGSLDDPNAFPPTRAVYRRHKVKWASEI